MLKKLAALRLRHPSTLMGSWMEERNVAEKVHKPQGWLDSETKLSQEHGGGSQAVDCSWSQSFKDNHAQTHPGNGQDYRVRGVVPELMTNGKLDCWSWIQSPLFKWKYAFPRLDLCVQLDLVSFLKMFRLLSDSWLLEKPSGEGNGDLKGWKPPQTKYILHFFLETKIPDPMQKSESNLCEEALTKY